MSLSNPALDNAYEYCRDRVSSHYENFPVASWLLPARLRKPISVIYAFARTADDFADEGSLTDQQRLTALQDYRNKLVSTANRQPPDDPVFTALADVLQQWTLPVSLLDDLITAFEMDITKKRFTTHAEVLHYCHYSANPVGRLLLHLFGKATEENLKLSDHICSALQIINFLQDIRQDYTESNRIYLPQQDLHHFKVTEQHITGNISDDAMRNYIRFEINRTRNMMLAGAPLGKYLTGRAGIEIRAIIQGGLRVLSRLEKQHDDVFSRPRLGMFDWFIILAKAILPV